MTDAAGNGVGLPEDCQEEGSIVSCDYILYIQRINSFKAFQMTSNRKRRGTAKERVIKADAVEKGGTIDASCPFSRGNHTAVSTDATWLFVMCLNEKCMAEGPVRETRQEAIDAWNACK
ncbi:hypothetical protein AA14337_3185 [Acetobacter malorum DSM 14337]|uniref:Uncharacterized protein n=1 Tax=Acetobacter malorum DSM 14337 TaxID=1307910 RepID=A0ABQ0Q049_9PROT|nr:hypothetical protein AA14337_3185 [Acetobacter malorum DSM 14337]